MTPAPHSQRVLIAPDKFKGTLSADRVAQAIATGWRRMRPYDELDLLPISDGGDGFGAIVGPQMFGSPVCARIRDASRKLRPTVWWWARERRTAIIESAAVIGISLFVQRRIHPFRLDTSGLGALLKQIAQRQPKECIIGLGGSATNDGGFGLALALGWKFLNTRDKPLQYWWQLESLAKIIPPKVPWRIPIIAAADVENRLIGDHGCSRVYGPQKGLSAEEINHAERCLTQLAVVYAEEFKHDVARVLAGGAAGGLGFGLIAFANAKVLSGFEIVAKATRLEQRIRKASLVITGEGRLDEQSLMGKALGRLAVRCKQLGVPCIGLAGTVQKVPEHIKTFCLTAALTDVTSLKAALTHPERSLSNLAERTARLWNKN